MADFIGAKCFACGHVIRVPATLGGKKAKCPKCGDIVILPSPSESTMGLVSDDMLPEVAKDEAEAILDGEEIPGEEQAEDMTPAPRTGESSRRHGGKTVPPRGRGGRARAGSSGGRLPAGRKSSNAPVIIGAAAGVIVLIAVIAVAAGGRGGDNPGPGPENGGKTSQPDPNELAGIEVRKAFDEFIKAWNRQDVERLLAIYALESEDEGRKIRAFISDQGFLLRVELKNVRVNSVQVAGETAGLRATVDQVTTTLSDGSKKEEKGLDRTYDWARRAEGWKLLTKPQTR